MLRVDYLFLVGRVLRQCFRTWAALQNHLPFWVLVVFSHSIEPSAMRARSLDSPPTIVAACSLPNVNLDIVARILSSSISFGFTLLMCPLIFYEIRVITDCLLGMSAFTDQRQPSERSTSRLLDAVFLTVLCFVMGNRRISPTSIPLISAVISPRFSSLSIIFSISFGVG